MIGQTVRCDRCNKVVDIKTIQFSKGTKLCEECKEVILDCKKAECCKTCIYFKEYLKLCSIDNKVIEDMYKKNCFR